MSREDRRRWEDKYRDHSRAAPLHCRDSLDSLDSMDWLPTPGTSAIAVDIACGSGRHIDALLSAGYRVVAADIARTALIKLAQHHRRERVWPLQVDLDDWPFAAGVFDLIVQCDFLDRRIFPPLRESLRPGGYLLIDTFCTTTAAIHAGPRNPAFRLRPGELQQRFADWEIVRSSGGVEGAQRAAMLARKPTA